MFALSFNGMKTDDAVLFLDILFQQFICETVFVAPEFRMSLSYRVLLRSCDLFRRLLISVDMLVRTLMIMQFKLIERKPFETKEKRKAETHRE